MPFLFKLKLFAHYRFFYLLTLSFISFFLFSSIAWSSIYYVDATNGNDSNNGTSQPTPWRTIAKVTASSFNAGDQILLKSGQIWREMLVVPSSGAPGNPITFGAYGAGASPIITGYNVFVGFSAITSNVYQLASVTIQPKVVAYNGTLLKYHHVGTAIGVNEWDWASNILYINVGGNPSAGIVEVGQRNFNITGVRKDYITIDGITMQGANITSVYLVTSTNNWIIKNSNIYNTLSGIQGASDAGNNNTIQDNSIHDTVEFGICWSGGKDSSGNIFQRNIVYNVGGKGGTPTNMSGIYAVVGSGTIIQNNTIHSCGETFGDHGIYLSASDTVVIRYNTIYNIPYGWGIKVSNSDTVDVYYNLMYNDGGGVVIEVGTPSYINVYNNVIANSAAGDVGQGLRASLGNHINWKNNIIYNVNYLTHGEGTMYNLYVDSSVTNLVSDYNIVYSPTATPSYAFVAGQARTWAQWQGLGHDIHGLNVDPKFVNAKGNDFHLEATSPAIDTGTNVGLIQDYYGNYVPQGLAPDIGAYESSAQSSVPLPPKGLQIIK